MFVKDVSGKFSTGSDWHFHYFPHLDEGYFKVASRLPADSMIVIHDAQYEMEGFLSGMNIIAKTLNIHKGVELSISHDVEKVKRNIDKIKAGGYEVILSVHTYKSAEDYLTILRENSSFFTECHHLCHPFHKEKVEIPSIIQRGFFDLVKGFNISVELNERYSRQYNIEFYNGIKFNCTNWYPATDAHAPKDVAIYRKLQKYNII